MKKWMTVNEASKELEVSPQAIRDKIKRKTIRSRSKLIKHITEVQVDVNE